MFHCQECNRVSKPGEQTHSVVVETRTHIFPYRYDAHRFRKDRMTEVRDDPGGKGLQIVKELKLCRVCFESRSFATFVDKVLDKVSGGQNGR